MKRLLVLAGEKKSLFYIMAFAMLLFSCGSNTQSQDQKVNRKATCYLNFSNVKSVSGVSSDSIFICIVGQDPNNNNAYSYLDFSTGKLITFSTYASGTTSKKLSSISGRVAIPPINSGRIYMVAGVDFTSTNFPSSVSGPSIAQVSNGGASAIFDFIEFDTHVKGYFNLNSSNVDMYAYSYTIKLKDTNNKSVVRGLTGSRQTIFNQLAAIPYTSSTAWYQDLFVKDSAGNILRFLAPQQAGYSDVMNQGSLDTTGTRAMCTYFNDYIQNKVFVPNRSITFFDKNLAKDSAQVSSDGTSMTIYGQTDTFTIQQPVSPINCPPLPADWHNQTGNDSIIDWGFTLFGNNIISALPNGWGTNAPDPALMAIMMSICRGVAHVEGKHWTDSANYYGNGMGSGGIVEYYASIIHQNAKGGMAYAFAYDDVYASNSSVFFNSGTVIQVTFNSLK